ncbi:MAG TPA: hypothetical protein VF316_07490 [Polyangiaceae bacterium]
MTKKREAHLEIDLRALRRALRGLHELSRQVKDGDAWDEPFPAELVLFPAVGRCRRLVYTGKLAFSNRLIAACGLPPRSVTLLTRAGLVLRCYADVVRREAHATGAEIAFVGDLEPFALSSYLSLVAGGFEGVPTADRLLKVRYLGVSDSWFALCREEPRPEVRHRLPGEATLHVKLTAFQKRNLEILEDSGVPWDSIVGREAMTLLRSGLSVAIEHASNPECYAPGFMEKLSRHVYGAR